MSRIFGQLFLNALAGQTRQHLQRAARQAGGQSVASQLRQLTGGRRATPGMLESILNAFMGTNNTSVREIRRAIGGGVSERDIASRLLREIEESEQPATTGRGGRRGGAGGGRGGGRRRTGTGAEPPEPPPIPPPIGRRDRANRDAPPRPGEESPFGQETLTPQSSNVFSFSYQAETSTLYVTFKANKLNPDSVGTGKGRRGGMEQLRGKLGSTISGKTNERGSMYAYLDVPARVYRRMQLAQSKGRFVWDELRVRGTIYGHKYRYQLVQGQVVTQRGVSGVYIPRKATAQGFRVRSVATLGQGRRRFESSTLPEQIGFRSRRPPGG